MTTDDRRKLTPLNCHKYMIRGISPRQATGDTPEIGRFGMTLLDFYFYSAPIAGLILFFTGAHLGKCVRTKEHSKCLKEVGRLYDELRWLRKESSDLELERTQLLDQVGRLQRQLDFERTNSLAKSEALTEIEEELEACCKKIESLESLFSKSTRIARTRDARIKELEERLSILSSQYEKLLRSHLRNGGTKIT